MLEEFERYFEMVDIKELKDFIDEAKKETVWIKTHEEFQNVPEITDAITFMTTLLAIIEEKIEGVKSLSSLDFKQKVELYGLVHLLHDICDSMEGNFDEDYDDDYDEDDEDFDDEEDENDETNSDDLNGKNRIIKLE